MSKIDELPEVLFGQEFATAIVLFEESIASKLNLNATDWRCLGIILKGSNITAKTLTEETNLTTGAITGIIDRLENKKFVQRKKNPSDRRSIIIEPLITYKDLSKMVDPIFGSFGREMGLLFSNYNQDEIILILNFLKKFTDIIKNETKKMKS